MTQTQHQAPGQATQPMVVLSQVLKEYKVGKKTIT